MTTVTWATGLKNTSLKLSFFSLQYFITLSLSSAPLFLSGCTFVAIALYTSFPSFSLHLLGSFLNISNILSLNDPSCFKSFTVLCTSCFSFAISTALSVSSIILSTSIPYLDLICRLAYHLSPSTSWPTAIWCTW